MLKQLILIIFSVFLIIPASVEAEENNNNPISLDSSQNPWRAVGIIEDNNNDKSCTAVIVGDYELLTSAYCLLNEKGEKPKSINQLTFKAGYKKGFYLAKTNISSFLMPKLNYPPQNINDLRNSWAFIFTTEPIGKMVNVFKIDKSPIDSNYLSTHKLITVGYKDNEINSGLMASIKCTLNDNSIKYNDKKLDKTSPLFLQQCKDYFKPLIGSLLVSIDSANNVSLVGIVSAKLNPKHNLKKSSPKSSLSNLNVIVPMNYLDNDYNKKSNISEKSQEDDEDEDNYLDNNSSNNNDNFLDNN